MRVSQIAVVAFFVAFVVGAPVACHEATPKATPDPTPTATTTSSASPLPSPAPPTAETICEASVDCGVWGECAFFERLPITGDVTTPPLPRWKATTGSWKGKIFYRSHQCWPLDAGPAQCALYCTGPGPTDGTCVDGLISETQICTGTAAPHPSNVRCEVRDGSCVRSK